MNANGAPHPRLRPAAGWAIAAALAAAPLAAADRAGSPPAGPILVEAEWCPTTGSASAFSTALHTAGAEASGRRYVALPPDGELTLTAPVAADGLVLRYSYPDAPAGGGESGTIDLVVGGRTLALPVTSRWSWEYGKPRWNSKDVWPQDPVLGDPRHFWDESSLRIPAVAAGMPVVVRNPDRHGRTILIDFAEFERVPAAVDPPPGCMAFDDWHPDRTGSADATALLQAALDAAHAAGRILHVPEGIYRIGSVDVRGGRLQGAGMWRTRFIGPDCRFNFAGGTATMADFAVFGETALRNDHSDAGNAFSGRPGDGSRLERIWVEHKKCAFWVVADGPTRPTRGLAISGCRFRDLMADGVNLCNGATDCVIEDCLVRNTGDDGLAAWSPNSGGRPPGGRNVIRRNLVQLPWVASGIALYGGGPFSVEGNTVIDTVTTGSGIFVSASFKSWPFAGQVRIAGNTLIRCGAHESGPGGPTGAIRFLALDEDMTAARFLVESNRIIAPLASGISIQGPRAIDHLDIAGLDAEDLGTAVPLDIRPGAKGSATVSALAVPGQDQQAWRIPAASAFTIIRREASSPRP